MKKRLFVLSTKRACPLSLAERLVYSYLVYRAKYDKSATAKGIAAFTGLHRGDSVRPALTVLEQHGLVKHASAGWRALSPTRETTDWFAARKGKSDQWYARMAYFQVYLPDRTKMTTRTAVVYWFLVSRRCSQRPQPISGIARCLSIGWHTANRAVRQLQRLGMIDAGLRPTEVTRDDFWLDGRKTKPKEQVVERIDNYRMSSLFLPGFTLDSFRGDRDVFDEHVDEIGTQMRKAGYAEADIHTYVRHTFDAFGSHLKSQKMCAFVRFSLESLFRKAERETERNRAKNTYYGKTSLGMLEHMTKLVIDRVNRESERTNEIEYYWFDVAA